MRGKVDGGSERESLFYDGISIDLKKAGCQKFEEFKQTYLLNVPWLQYYLRPCDDRKQRKTPKKLPLLFN